MKRFEERVVLVTGAASGIGRAAALRLAAEGAQCCCCDVDSIGLGSLVAEIHAAGGEAFAQALDISQQEQVEAALAACLARYGQLDAVVNMAGILRFANAHQTSLDTWQQILAVNLTGSFLLCRAVLPELLKRGGNIVNAASTASLQGLPWGVAYAASKGGVLALTRSIAVEYGKRGVRANCVCPGDINTNMVKDLAFPEDADFTLLSRLTSLSGAKPPEVVAGVIAMLASGDGCHINGEFIRVDGGMQA